jgi:exosortase
VSTNTRSGNQRVNGAPRLERSRQFEYFQLYVFIAVSIALWWRSLFSTLRLAVSSDAYTYILLVVPLSTAVIYIENKPYSSKARSERWLGAMLVSGALLLQVLMAWNVVRLDASGNKLALSMAALVICWIGAVIFCFGVETFNSLVFPLCFLFLLIPLPDRALGWVTEFLQQQSAWAASILFRMIGVPVATDGTFLSIPGLRIEVARECSSIRSSTMLIVVTLILSHLFLRSPWRKALLVLAAFPLTIAKNALRIFAIVELGTRVDPRFLHGKLHHSGGIVFLGVALIVILLLLWALRQNENGEVRLVID